MNKKTVWVTWAKSESGDDYGPFVFQKKPTEEELEDFWKTEGAGEWADDGPGFKGSYLHVDLAKCEVL